MNASKIVYRILTVGFLIASAFALSSRAVVATGPLPPLPVIGPRLNPPAIPHSDVADPDRIYNELIVAALPAQSRAADIADEGAPQESVGRGVAQTTSDIASGITLYTGTGGVCNDFNTLSRWSSQAPRETDIWTDHYAGWGAYALDDGLFHAANVVFSLERTTGPGSQSGPNQFSLKIASNQPYAAGVGSPIISTPPGAEVVISVKYLIFDHDTQGQDYDWASLGLKRDAAGSEASYVNGYVRGQWAELTHRVVASSSGQVMILIQAHSPAALNSNIYFDDVQIAVDGQYLSDCTLK